MLKSRQELIDIRKEYAKYLTAQQHKILVCAGTGCIASGSLKVYAEFKRLLEQKGLPCLVELKKENEENGISAQVMLGLPFSRNATDISPFDEASR